MATYEILSAFPSGDKRKSLAVQRGFAAFRKLVVVREILEDVRNDEEAFHAFLRDAKIGAVFSHPNIADIYDLDAQENQLLLVSEFVPGASLGEVIRACQKANQRLPLEVTLRAVQHAAMALHYAHQFVDPSGRPMGVVHKHLNEEALVISFDGMTKVTDFCVPQSADAEPTADPFRAPEYDWGDQLDGRADVYALGVLLQRALQALRSPAGGKPGVAVPNALETVVARATARTREQRFNSALELARACEQAAGRGWEPAQLSAFMQRLFQDRRAKMAELFKVVEVKETTAVMKLSEIFDSGGADAESAISEATQPKAKSPFYEDDQADEAATSVARRPPPTVGVAAVREPPALAAAAAGTGRGGGGGGLRLGRALLKLLLWVILIGGAFSAGAYVMDPPRARAVAQVWLKRASTVGAIPDPAAPPADGSGMPVGAVAAVDSQDGGASMSASSVSGELADAGALALEDSSGPDGGEEQADAGAAVTSGADAGTSKAAPAKPPKKKKRR